MDKIKSFFKNPVFQVISKIISWTVLVILIMVASFLVYYVISAKVYEVKGEKFHPQFSLYTIISSSMEPNILVYDVVFDSKVNDVNSIKVGDIITFTSTSSLTDGMTLTHRVVSIIETEDGLKFRTKGDNNITPDPSLVDGYHILGRVVFKLPQLGRVQFLLQSKGGWLFALLIPAMGVVIYDVLKVIRLSGIKKNIVSINNNKEDKLRKEKEEKLKKQLKSKFVNVESISPMMTTITDNMDNEEDNNVDLNRVLKNIKKMKNDKDKDVLPSENIKLPKIKKK